MIKQLVIILLLAMGMAAGEGADYREIGRMIWVNTANPNPSELVRWDEKKGCVVMGIGGSSWYSAERSGHADEEFPKFVAFAESQGVKVPATLRGASPWTEAGELAADASGRREQLQKWLAGHLDVQARFLIAKAHAALPTMMRKSSMRAEICTRFEQLALTPQGLYCMADFLSFMGAGIVEPGQQGYGLLQALEAMRPGMQVNGAEFAHAAATVLQHYAQNNPPRNAQEKSLLALQLKRCRSYATAFHR